MANISVPNTFVDGTLITAASVNADFNEIQTKYNAGAVQTDVAKTITASHTFTPSQTFNGGIAVTGSSTLNGAVSGVTTLATSGAINGQTIANPAAFTGEVAVGGQVRFSANTVLSGPGTVARQATTGLTLWSATGSGSDFRIYDAAGSATAILDVPTGTRTANFGGQISAATGLTATTGGVSVLAGGATITGNSTVTGNLTVTGTLIGGTGLNNYVRRTTDLTPVSTNTDLTLNFTIGAAEEWEAEYLLAHTNASAATLTLKVTGPASFTYVANAVGGVQGVTGTTISTTANVVGNLMGNFTMDATLAYTNVRVYAKGGGTGGTVSLQGTVSAGTGTLKAGSFVRYSRIA